MQSNVYSIIEATLQNHQIEINKNKDSYHELDKNILALRTEVKNNQDITRQELSNLSDKIDGLGDNYKKLEDFIENKIGKLDERVDALEVFHNTRQWWLNAALKILKRAAQLWWLWIFIIVSCFAFDIEFKVKNPDLVPLLTHVIKSKL